MKLYVTDDNYPILIHRYTSTQVTMATGTNTPEYEIIQRNFHSICTGISQDLPEFAAKVFEKHMIGRNKLQEIFQNNETEQGLIIILLQRIEQNNSEFYEILEILQSMPTLAPVVNMLQLQNGNVSSEAI